MKKIKTFEDACNELGIDPNNLPDVSMIEDEGLQRSVIAFYKLTIIAKALNSGWQPDWSDWNEYKYYPYFYLRAGGFACGGWAATYTSTDVGSRLCFKTSALAEYAGKQFTDIYSDYLRITPVKAA